MAKITEDYVSFETAKLLKEKGFNEPTLAYAYGNDMVNYYSKPRITDISSIEAGKIPMPTLQMAMKWLRNTFHFEIYPFHDAIQENNDWWYRIEQHSKGCSLTEHESDAIYKTYEQSCEEPIKYCLKNLI